MKEKIVVIGGGGHAKVLISVIKKSLTYKVVGYSDSKDLGAILGVPYLGDDNKLGEIFAQGVIYAAIGIGQVNLTKKRFEIMKNIKKLGFTFPIIISKDAIVNEDVSIEEGSQILDGAALISGTRIGKFCIINTNSTIEHDCNIGAFCHIATGAVLSGGIEVGDFSMIGSNAVVVQYKKIASNCMLGSGCVVTKDILTEGIYIGNPARKLKEKQYDS